MDWSKALTMVTVPAVCRTAKNQPAGRKNVYCTVESVLRFAPTTSAPVWLLRYFPIADPVPPATAFVAPIKTSAVLVVPTASVIDAVDVILTVTRAAFVGSVAWYAVASDNAKALGAPMPKMLNANDIGI